MISVVLSERTVGTYCWGSIHHRVLAHEASLGVIEHDEFDRFIDPPVAKPEFNTVVGLGDCTVPYTTREPDRV